MKVLTPLVISILCAASVSAQVTVTLDPDAKYQTIRGHGSPNLSAG